MLDKREANLIEPLVLLTRGYKVEIVADNQVIR